MRNDPTGLARWGALGVAAALVLAGCGAGGGDAGGGGDDTGAELEASAEDFLAGRGEELGVGSISVLAQSSPQADAIQQISGQFTELTGITVDWTILDEQSTENRAAVALGSGDGGYDVLQTPSGFIPTYVDRGWLEPIGPLVDDAESIVPGWDLAAFGEGTTSLLSREDELYGVPMFIGTQMFYYRTDVFAEHGIDAVPTTYEELVDVVHQIHSDDVAGIALRTAPSPSQLLFVWSAWLYANGGSYYETFDDGTYSGSALDSPEAVESLTTYTDLVQNYAPSGATNWSVDDVTRAFASGRVAIVQEGAVFGGTFNNPEASQVAGNIDSFTLPEGPAGSYVPYNTHGWTIAANSDATDAAWLFTQWATLAQTLTAATQTDANFGAPPLAEVYESPEYEESYGFGSFVPTVTGTIGIANDGGVSPFEDDPNYLPATPDWATVGQQIAEELSKAVTGQVEVAEAIRAAAAYLE
ncbi:extracellular solute-binding protein family 1 [Beutenbergia cavernae DSM 12333]|uniref:Extracellular solute-binding protein family 1 n=1 Tax=Beutenbergia cavernae (strain ATCC BAA-8 / DSM 12333 / CCUG 43141 / JCM 11478 / NBRC 16432 / NCIMB 13614 / HKI 0122) TaxID=471853 RepID=C5BXU1_BEUC1|nr:sugar ABC transporter substrate-binding protein [Beutenbergia cavernae]ACQ78835.1 extracellular solute-binding protein family 1 [Beutenbergia cavernae DSM 12333]